MRVESDDLHGGGGVIEKERVSEAEQGVAGIGRRSIVSFFKFPAVSVRNSTERPEALDKGNLIIGGLSSAQILQAIDMATAMVQNDDLGIDVPCYQDLNFSTKVIKIIQSYTNIVNKTVWKK